MRNHFKQAKFVSQITWTVEMDAILIENSGVDIQVLEQLLNVEEIEIQERKKILGLFKRNRQLRKIF